MDVAASHSVRLKPQCELKGLQLPEDVRGLTGDLVDQAVEIQTDRRWTGSHTGIPCRRIHLEGGGIVVAGGVILDKALVGNPLDNVLRYMSGNVTPHPGR